MKKIFITGATGFLGSNVVRSLINGGYDVYCLRRKVSNPIRLIDINNKINWLYLENFNFNEFFINNKINCLIHCATDYGRKIVDPIQTIEANLLLPLKLLQSAVSGGVKVFINTDTILDKGINNYSLSKNQFSEWLNSYSDQIVAINLALQHFYGPGDDPTKFITNIIQALLMKHQSIKLTQGEQKRDFVYIDDVVQAVLLVVEASKKMERAFYRFEVGSGCAMKIREIVDLAKILSNNTSTSLNYGDLPYRKGELMEIKTDISGISSLGWKVSTSVETGLLQTIIMEKERLGI